MDDGLRFRTLIAECVDVGHHIMAEPLFISFRRGEIDGFQMFFHLGDLYFGNRKSKLSLPFGQGNPQAPESYDLVFG